MTAKTSTERSRDFRERQKTVKALEEVRGIWAPKWLHKTIKAEYKHLQKVPK